MKTSSFARLPPISLLIRSSCLFNRATRDASRDQQSDDCDTSSKGPFYNQDNQQFFQGCSQLNWRREVECAVNEIVMPWLQAQKNSDDSSQSLIQLLKNMAAWRARAADKLEHGDNLDMRRRYGALSWPGCVYIEPIPRAGNELTAVATWLNSMYVVDELIQGMLQRTEIHSFPQKPICDGYDTDNEEIEKYELEWKKLNEKTTGDNTRNGYCAVKRADNKIVIYYSENSAYIFCYDKKYCIYYGTHEDRKDMAVKFKKIEDCVKEILRAQNRVEFLTELGRFCYKMAHYKFCQLGDASIIECLMHGFAQAKGFQLGDSNPDLKISWHMRALLSPKEDEYSAWFAENAFLYLVIDRDISLAKHFTF